MSTKDILNDIILRIKYFYCYDLHHKQIKILKKSMTMITICNDIMEKLNINSLTSEVEFTKYDVLNMLDLLRLAYINIYNEYCKSGKNIDEVKNIQSKYIRIDNSDVLWTYLNSNTTSVQKERRLIKFVKKLFGSTYGVFIDSRKVRVNKKNSHFIKNQMDNISINRSVILYSFAPSKLLNKFKRDTNVLMIQDINLNIEENNIPEDYIECISEHHLAFKNIIESDIGIEYGRIPTLIPIIDQKYIKKYKTRGVISCIKIKQDGENLEKWPNPIPSDLLFLITLFSIIYSNSAHVKLKHFLVDTDGRYGFNFKNLKNTRERSIMNYNNVCEKTVDFFYKNILCEEYDDTIEGLEKLIKTIDNVEISLECSYPKIQEITRRIQKLTHTTKNTSLFLNLNLKMAKYTEYCYSVICDRLWCLKNLSGVV